MAGERIRRVYSVRSSTIRPPLHVSSTFALPFTPRWKAIKYKSLGPFGGFIEAAALLEKIRPLPTKGR